MNSGSGMPISPEALAVLAAIAALVVMIAVVWYLTAVLHQMLSPLATVLMVFITATALIILLAGVAGVIPGIADAKTAQFGPFSLDVKGPLAVLVVATFVIYGAAGYVSKQLLRLYPKPPRKRRPLEHSHLKRREGYLPPDTP